MMVTSIYLIICGVISNKAFKGEAFCQRLTSAEINFAHYQKEYHAVGHCCYRGHKLELDVEVSLNQINQPTHHICS